MFGTLRQADSAHETFCSEPTLPPFQGKRQGKLAQIACVACRASKVEIDPIFVCESSYSLRYHCSLTGLEESGLKC
jgi:hypothetical protein